MIRDPREYNSVRGILSVPAGMTDAGRPVRLAGEGRRKFRCSRRHQRVHRLPAGAAGQPGAFG